MMIMRIPVIALLVLSLVAVLPLPADAEETQSSLYVKKVENLPEDFLIKSS